MGHKRHINNGGSEHGRPPLRVLLLKPFMPEIVEKSWTGKGLSSHRVRKAVLPDVFGWMLRWRGLRPRALECPPP